MGKLLSFNGYTRADAESDYCGVHSSVAETCRHALEGDADALAETTLDALLEAHDALCLCERLGCDNHAHDRHARDLLDSAIDAEMAREEAAEQVEADSRSHAGACGCESCQ